MAYSPQNLTVFTAAYAGCMAGLVASGRMPNDSLAADYSGYANITSAYAQSFDTVWGTVAPDTLQVMLIELASKAVWEQRNVAATLQTQSAGNYTALVTAIIAFITQGGTNVAALGITPNLWPTVGGWNTVLDLNLANVGTQSIGVDGNFQLAGMTCVKVNSANESFPTTITQGAGLRIRPAAGSDYSGNTRTLPLIWIPLGQIPNIGPIDYSSNFRVWINVAADNAAADFDATMLGLDSNSTAIATLMQRGNNGGQKIGVSQIFNGANSGASPILTTVVLGDANRAIMLQSSPLVGLAVWGTFGANVVGNAPWPAINGGLTWVKGFDVPTGAVDLTTIPSSILTGIGIMIGARGAGHAGYDTTVSRVRLDVHL
jgi:hypothetical protein